MVLIQSLLLKRFLFLGLFSKPIRRFISSASWVFCSLKNDKDPGENKGYITFQSSNPILLTAEYGILEYANLGIGLSHYINNIERIWL